MTNPYIKKAELETLCISFEICETFNLYNKKIEDVKKEISNELKKRDEESYNNWKKSGSDKPSKYFL
jgi:hypothetical protein